MASMVSRSLLLALPFAALSMSPAAGAAELSPDQARWYRAQLGQDGGAFGNLSPAPSAIGDAVVEWTRLQQTEALDFPRIARFLSANPGWPGEARLRKIAESAIPLDQADPRAVTAFFAQFPPTTAAGHVRHALALHALGRRDEARVAARAGWVAGPLPDADQYRLFSVMPDAFSPAEHDRRVDILLARGATASAAFTVPLTSPALRGVFEARLALRGRAPDAAIRAATVEAANPALLRSDPGYIADKATWLRRSGQVDAARQLLAAPRQLTRAPADAEDWYATLLTNAKGAQDSGGYATAFAIARQLDDGVAPGTVVRDQPLGVRDHYTSLAWMAGNLALRQMGQPRVAAEMFRKYAAAARSPQTQTKGLYWAARAADRANDATLANSLYQEAAKHADQFYGQLSRERLNLAQPTPQPPPTPPVTDAQRRAFNGSSVIRATRALGELGMRTEQTQFLRAIAANATSDADHYLASRLASEIGRPDLGVMIGRSARQNGIDDYEPASFPTMPVPAGLESNWTFIHAITRQESQFDRAAVSRVGARGMMQLMPGTAREVAGKLGLSYDPSALVNDPSYNFRLGSSYFQQLLSYYGGSYPLATAAYNAGAGNVNKWLRANGDPRTGSVDIVDWIEAIPFTETRGYVQRVLENAVVYDTIHPDPSRARAGKPLSRYLGRR